MRATLVDPCAETQLSCSGAATPPARAMSRKASLDIPMTEEGALTTWRGVLVRSIQSNRKAGLIWRIELV